MGWWSPVPVYIDGCPCRDPHIIVLDYTRRIDQIQSTMDKSGFGTSMLAYDSVRGDWANTSLIKSPRGHTTGSGNAQHYMLACVLLIIAGRNGLQPAQLYSDGVSAYDGDDLPLSF